MVKMGMQYSYTPGPVELLEESFYHAQGPDYPQVAIPERIRKAVLRRFALHSTTTPLVDWLQAQHFKCIPAASGLACHLDVQVFSSSKPLTLSFRRPPSALKPSKSLTTTN